MQCAGEMIDSWSTDEIKNWNLTICDIHWNFYKICRNINMKVIEVVVVE